MIKSLLTILIGTVACYLSIMGIVEFITWGKAVWNPADWNEGLRVGFVVAWFLWLLLVSVEVDKL